MELDADDMKRELMRKSAKHREQIEGEVKLITENTEKVITNALIIGGSLALTYYLVTRFTGGSRKKSKGKHKRIKVVQAETPEIVEVAPEEQSSGPSVISQVGTALATQASVFLLGLAKEKLMEFLQTVGEKKKEG